MLFSEQLHLMLRRITRFCFGAMAIVSVLLSSGIGVTVASAGETRVIPSCELREEYTDNVMLSTNDRKSDFVTTVSPNLTLSGTTERLNASVTCGLAWLTYADTAGLDAVDYRIQGQSGYRWSPLTDLGLSAAYVRDSRPDSVHQLTDISSGAGSDQQNYSVRIGHRLAPLTSGTISYAFGKEEYDNRQLQGNEVHAAGLALTHDLGNLMKGLVSSAYKRTEYRLSRSEDYSLSAGASWQPGERLAVTGTAGGRFTHSLFDLANGEGSKDTWGAIGSLTVTHTGEQSRTSLSFVRDFAAASGQVGATERTQTGLTHDLRFTEKLSAQAAVRYTINSSEFTASDSEDIALRCSAGLSYELNRDLSIGFNYSYYRIDYNPGSRQAEQNTAMFMLRWQYPIDTHIVTNNK